ncbi:Galactose-binding domain-like [Plasmopara halstedii]|uniref:Galactose-binding domain-like n=1 Tax=Plasmopara halstedii TaxID=4781 RepID=A0A0P1AYY4_PLAHL|nr:Galactose-binding domain-like [Plasmopara halstedii]CEG47672.1 Galactose-binding domain-like [Plasmopara halstedii]|eukprot:XP_024584041.1 Galactose-binding domain-like [Plasmopara halstedii]
MDDPDVNFEAQINELVSSPNVTDRCTVLEEHQREMELRKIQADKELEYLAPSPAASKRKSFRPVSAKPRMLTLTSLAEDLEVETTAFQESETNCLGQLECSHVLEISSSSYDELFSPANVLENSSRTLWISSGMFPQFLRIVLREPKPVAAVEITCKQINKLQLRASCNRHVAINRMTIFAELEVGAADSRKLDTHRFSLTCRSFKNANDSDGNDESTSEPLIEAIQINIDSGHSAFVCVYFVRLCIANSDEIRR